MLGEEEYICPNCKYIGKPETHSKGNFLAEVLLYVCFILPGLIYSIWRESTTKRICPKCRGALMVRKDSPMGQKILENK